MRQDQQSKDIPLDSAVFRDAMRKFATTVSIISCTSDGCRYGMSATAVTSLSADPPSLLVCVNKSAATHRALSRGGRFCVNVLRSFHCGLSRAFSGRLKGEDRFDLGDWREGDDGTPFLGDAQANIFCEIARIMDHATHSIFVAHVYSVRVQEDVDPLLYQDGKYVIAQPVADDLAEQRTDARRAAVT